MVDDLRADFTQDRKSKDGLNRKLFPLTTAEQGRSRFQLAGEEIYHDLRVSIESPSRRKRNRPTLVTREVHGKEKFW